MYRASIEAISRSCFSSSSSGHHLPLDGEAMKDAPLDLGVRAEEFVDRSPVDLAFLVKGVDLRYEALFEEAVLDPSFSLIFAFRSASVIWRRLALSKRASTYFRRRFGEGAGHLFHPELFRHHLPVMPERIMYPSSPFSTIRSFTMPAVPDALAQVLVFGFRERAEQFLVLLPFLQQGDFDVAEILHGNLLYCIAQSSCAYIRRERAPPYTSEHVHVTRRNVSPPCPRRDVYHLCVNIAILRVPSCVTLRRPTGRSRSPPRTSIPGDAHSSTMSGMLLPALSLSATSCLYVSRLTLMESEGLPFLPDISLLARSAYFVLEALHRNPVLDGNRAMAPALKDLDTITPSRKHLFR